MKKRKQTGKRVSVSVGDLKRVYAAGRKGKRVALKVRKGR